jgi:hypothetical protein
MSRKEKVFTTGAMIVVGTLTTLGGIASIGWAARSTLAIIDQHVSEVRAEINQHATWDQEWTRGAELRFTRDEIQFTQCCPMRRK